MNAKREAIEYIAIRKVFDDIDEVFKLNSTQALGIYAECNCCSRFAKKLLEVKKRHLPQKTYGG